MHILFDSHVTYPACQKHIPVKLTCMYDIIYHIIFSLFLLFVILKLGKNLKLFKNQYEIGYYKLDK